MKKIKWGFLLLAFIATACIAGIGIAFAEESVVGVLACLIIFVLIVGLGFMKKKKMRENGTL